MENQVNILKFKTNINCSGCVNKISPVLNNADGINNWEVDTSSKDKTLSVQSSGILENEIIEKVKNAGFTIEPLKK